MPLGHASASTRAPVLDLPPAALRQASGGPARSGVLAPAARPRLNRFRGGARRTRSLLLRFAGGRQTAAPAPVAKTLATPALPSRSRGTTRFPPATA